MSANPAIRKQSPRIVFGVQIALAIAALLVRVVSGGPASDPAARTPEQTVDAFYSALQANNAAQALSLLSPDATVFELGKVDRSRKDYAAVHLPADLEIASRGRRELLSRRKGDVGDARWVSSTYREFGRLDAPQGALLTETVILRATGGNWQIVHLHWSFDAPAPAPK
jgi:hypothetical protein